jgi:integrase
MGNIYQRERERKDGSTYLENTWTLRYYSPFKKRTVEEPTGLKATPANRKKAEVMLRDREHKKDVGEIIAAPQTKRTMMVQLLEMLRDDYKRNGRKDLYSMELRLDNHLIPYFKTYRAAVVDYNVISAYSKKRQAEGARAATVNRELSHLSKSFTLGIKARSVVGKPIFDTLKENNRRKGFAEEPAFRKVYAALPVYIKPIAELAYFTGMREGELLTLLWEQVDLIGCCIRLEETKNGDPREIHYGENAELKSMIDTQWERKLETEVRIGKQIDHLFFRCSTGKRIIDFRVAWNNANEKAKLKKPLLFHDLRRTAVRNLIRAGVPESVAMLISGHETRSMLDRYNIRNPADTRAALGKVSRKIDSQIDSQTEQSTTQLQQ